MNPKFKAFAIVVVTAMMVTLAVQTYLLSERVDNLSVRANALYVEVVQMELVYETVYRQHLDVAVQFAPKGKSIYQLRGDAHTEAQSRLDYLTTKHKLPHHELLAIRFRGALPHGAAGQATTCDQPHRVISLNEILYLRNYEEFIHGVIPHEVAHVFTCLNGGYGDEDPHGPKWESAMTDLHFLTPEKEKKHELDMGPVYRYQIELTETLGELNL